MLKKDNILKVLYLQKRGFKFLSWVTEQVDSGKLPLYQIQHSLNDPIDFTNWLNTYYEYLPTEILPKKKDIKLFCNYFVSYFNTSFELIENPGKEWKSLNGCHCSICIVLANSSHLKTKKPSKYDKKVAYEKRIEAILKIASFLNKKLDKNQAEDIAKTEIINSAYIAYFLSLVDRLNGESLGGTFNLVLWRNFAWKITGSPIQNFSFQAENIIKAENDLKEIINQYN